MNDNDYQSQNKNQMQAALFFAAKTGDIEKMKYLLGCGVDISTPDETGQTGFDYLLEQDLAKAKEFLLQILQVAQERIRAIKF